jgi:sigma-E factor negative regulatory protein RseC
MIEENATVVEVDSGYAIVETQQKAACGSCNSAGSCSTTVLSGLFKRRHNQLKVLNPIGAQPGQQVIIGLQEQALLKVSFLAYLLPLAGMFLLAMLAQPLAQNAGITLGELPGILGGLLGFVTGLILFKRISQSRSSNPDFQAVILRQAMSQQVHLS